MHDNGYPQGKCFNDTGKPGGCIPIDQRVEHEVRDVKDHFARLRKNQNETSAQRYCHSQSKGQTILKTMDRVLGVTPQSKGHSTMSSADDVEIVKFQDDVTRHFLTTLETFWSVLTWEN